MYTDWPEAIILLHISNTKIKVCLQRRMANFLFSNTGQVPEKNYLDYFESNAARKYGQPVSGKNEAQRRMMNIL
jgi:hypothetical protein